MNLEELLARLREVLERVREAVRAPQPVAIPIPVNRSPRR
jgi:hypothetical protein